MNAPNFIHMRDCSVGGGSAANEADRTVVLTTATSEDYIRECNELSYGVKRYLRMPCTHVTLPPALAPSAKAFTRLEPLLLPDWVGRWRPEAEFCVKRQSGWRQAHILKTQGLLMLLSRSLHVLLLDADRRLEGNPLPALLSTGMDVAGMRDEAFLNIGLMLVRSNIRTMALVQRVANRTLAAWDQAIFAEELVGMPSISCCYTNAFIRQCVDLVERTHRLNKNADLAAATQWRQISTCEPPHVGAASFAARRHILQLLDKDENAAAAEDEIRASRASRPIALPPPPRLAMFTRWNPHQYNELPLEARRYSRCTRTPCKIIVPIECNASRQLRCTNFPPGTEGMADVARCLHGNSLRDGFRYAYNRYRGTPHASCHGACSCCRQLRSTSAPET